MPTNKPLKIAVYSGAVPSTTFIERLIRGLAEMGHEVQLFGSLNASGAPEYPVNVKMCLSKNGIWKALQLIYWGMQLRLRQNEAKQRLDHYIQGKSANRRQAWRYAAKYYPVLLHRPDIFHLQWAKSLGDWMWVQDFGIKLVLSLRGAHINYSPVADPELAATYRRLFPEVDGFHGVSKAIVEEARNYGLDLKKSKVVYSGLESSDFDLDTESPPPQVPLRLLSIGRAHWKKGYAYALRTMKLLKDTGIAFKYTIIGGESDEELQFTRHKLGLTQEVSLQGRIPFQAVQNYMRNSDILLLPSVEEGIANVVLEAMKIGLPVCSTDCGGMAEVIAHRHNGWLVPVRQSEAMAEAIREMMELSREEKQQLIEAARKTVAVQHSKERMLQDMDDLYQMVVAAS